MSIAGIAKEVFTILISSWFFGDKLTLLNGAGVTITICGMSEYFIWIPRLSILVTAWVSGIGLFTHHKYRKSIDSKVPLDAHGNPIAEVDEMVGPDDSGLYQLEERTGLTGEPRGEPDEDNE